MEKCENKNFHHNQCLEVSRNLIDYAVHKNLESILGFSMKRTDCRDDAEDLTQDIVMEIYRSYVTIKRYEGHEALEGWMWAVARHTYCRWLNKKKKNTVSYIEGMINEDLYEELEEAIENQIVRDEELNLLRREISMLSKNYRDIIVLYYLEGKTAIEISEEIELPLSTVKWRLHEGKRIIRERMGEMKVYTEKTYAPGKLWIASMGSFNSTYSSFYVYDQVKSLLRQNIVLSIYRKPLDVKEISMELGVPVVYLEEEINSLVEEGLIKERGSQRYQSDFIIITADMKKDMEVIFEELGRELGEYLFQTLNKIEKDIRNIGFIGCDKSLEEMIWSIIPYCISKVYSDLFEDFELPKKPHGNSWKIAGFEGTRKEYPWVGGLATNSFKNGIFKQTIYWSNSLTYRAGFLETNYIEFCYDCFTNKIDLNCLDEDKKEIVSELIGKGFLIKDSNSLNWNVIAFTEAQGKQFESIIKNNTLDLNKKILTSYIQRIENKLEKLVPVELQDDMKFASCILINHIAGYAVKYLVDINKLIMPKELSTSTKGIFIEYKP